MVNGIKEKSKQRKVIRGFLQPNKIRQIVGLKTKTREINVKIKTRKFREK